MAENNTLLFQEIDEEVRAERLRQWWQRFGSWIVGICVLAVLATIGYQYDRNRKLEANQQVTSALLASAEKLERMQYESAAAMLEKTPANAGNVQYIAQLRAAQANEMAGKSEKSKAQYGKLAEDKKAGLIASFAALQTGRYEAISEADAFSPLARELQAITLYQQGKTQEAQALLKQLEAETTLTPSARSRIAELRLALR
jgi:hypothetical protein